MSSKEALDLCPKRSLSLEIMRNTEKWASRFVRFSSAIQIWSEPMSIDEAYLDVTENKIQSKSAVKIALWFSMLSGKSCISQLQRVFLIINFFGQDGEWLPKPRGLTVVLPRTPKISWARWTLPNFMGRKEDSGSDCIRWGSILERDLLAIPRWPWLTVLALAMISSARREGFTIALSKPSYPQVDWKERTYRKLLYAEDDILEEIANLSSKVANRWKNGKQGKTLVLKVRYGDFTTLTKRMTLTEPTREAERINRSARQIFKKLNRQILESGFWVSPWPISSIIPKLPWVEEKRKRLVCSLVVFWYRKGCNLFFSQSDHGRDGVEIVFCQSIDSRFIRLSLPFNSPFLCFV